MRKLMKILGVVVAVLLVCAAVFYFAFLRGLPRPEIALQPIRFTGMEQPGQHDCLWMGPVTHDAYNTAYPDGGAIYWPTVFTFPAVETDSYLEIAGAYPMARYMSLHSYGANAAPYDGLTDINILPDQGAENPFVTGSFKPDQSYTLRVYPRERPETAPQNALYLGPLESVSRTPLILRNYVSEVEGDPMGGAGLPKVALVRPNGERVEGEALCKLLNSPEVGSPERYVAAPVIPRDAYAKMIRNREVYEKILNSKNPWTVFWDPKLSVLRLMSPTLEKMFRTAAAWGMVDKKSGFFANFDNEYVSMYINEAFGDVTVLEGKLPRTPETGIAGTDTTAYDMRYWSLCTNEGLATTRYTDCVYDSNVVTDADRNYRIVISKAANRPANATAECGATWLDSGDKGDGAGNESLSLLILRNMLPNPAFKQAVQNIPAVGQEHSTMGEYLPVPQHTTKADFESLGCDAN